MIAGAFVDTNVLLYTIDEDPVSAVKRERARHVLLTERWGWSFQVAAESPGPFGFPALVARLITGAGAS